MKKAISLLLLCLLTTLSLFAAAQAETEVSLYAVTVGKADAILVKAGEHAFLVDAAYTRSRGRILYAMRQLGIERLDGVFVTHTDNDHTNGLEWLAESDIEIGGWYASAMYTGVKEGKHPAEKAAALRGENVIWLKQGDQLTFGDAVLDVLAPGKLFEDKDNNNSLVMMLRTDVGNILLAGDMEYAEEEWLLNSGADIRCDVLKVGNHADDDTGSAEFLLAASPSFAVISTDSYEKPETPDPNLLERLNRIGAEVCQTQAATGGVWMRMNSAGIFAEYVNLPQPLPGTEISEIVVEDDRIVLTNTGAENADLSGCYLLTEKKNNFFVFPQGTLLAPGESVTVGSNSTEGAYDLLWDDKKIINKKKTDSVLLYNADGVLISSMDNGL